MDKKDFKLPDVEDFQMSEIEDRLKEIKDRTTDFIQKNPMTSIAIAVGVGYLIGKLLSGRRS